MDRLEREKKMQILSGKLLNARKLIGYSRKELAEMVGVSPRSIYTYEMMTVKPRPAVIRRLADTLQVSPLYLDNDGIFDPLYGIERKEYVEEAAKRFGEKSARELNSILERSTALFAGGDIPQEDKDLFFDALASAYYRSKDEAKRRYGRKDNAAKGE
jgi:transcriptional regulator with XRE-family HTH domain